MFLYSKYVKNRGLVQMQGKKRFGGGVLIDGDIPDMLQYFCTVTFY